MGSQLASLRKCLLSTKVSQEQKSNDGVWVMVVDGGFVHGVGGKEKCMTR